MSDYTCTIRATGDQEVAKLKINALCADLEASGHTVHGAAFQFVANAELAAAQIEARRVKAKEAEDARIAAEAAAEAAKKATETAEAAAKAAADAEAARKAAQA